MKPRYFLHKRRIYRFRMILYSQQVMTQYQIQKQQYSQERKPKINQIQIRVEYSLTYSRYSILQPSHSSLPSNYESLVHLYHVISFSHCIFYPCYTYHSKVFISNLSLKFITHPSQHSHFIFNNTSYLHVSQQPNTSCHITYSWSAGSMVQLPFNFVGILRSHNTPTALRHLIHPTCILCVTSSVSSQNP